MTRLSLGAGTLAVAMLWSGPASGQATFTSGVDAVRLDVSVTRGGQPVVGLTADDFVVTDNGVPQRVESILLDELPVSVFLVLDTSGSVAGVKLRHLIGAGQALVEALRPADRAALITFSIDVTARVPLTDSKTAINQALLSLNAGGSTAMRDAVYTTLQLQPDDETRSVAIVFTDGFDTASWLSESDLVTTAERAGVVIHAVDLITESPGPPGPTGPVLFGNRSVPFATSWRAPSRSAAFLESLVAAAGGRRWSATTSGNPQELFTRALDEMRARYLLTFYIQGANREGWHDLNVTLKRERGEVKARRGYFVRASK